MPSSRINAHTMQQKQQQQQLVMVKDMTLKIFFPVWE
jgi:hypothetical protein